ncbi:transmembrane protein 232 [Gracilinanus agilis]|uniref:transmembrane protein 232 n=1 Tax=Gracilinanus agilis TaxID=191870 RepID=UPI001CFC6EF2|nr:transmembrane protein 232 [Gracilinanus agilis]
MPITKVPVINRFGVISTSYHEELLKHRSKNLTEPHIELSKKPLSITKEFINKFNDTENLEDKKYLQDKARKMLLRCKRRLGLSSLGVGHHVDLPTGWIEAIYLAQCKGQIQEEALNMLCTSLDHASLNCSHLPALFFIAESVLYRICCDASQKSYLYASEIKLIKIGFLIFLRLFVYHLHGNLEGFEEHLFRLQPYLYALNFCEFTYYKYPNILLSTNFIRKTGEIICNPKKLPEAPEISITKEKDLGYPDLINKSKPYWKRQEISHFLWHCVVVWSCVKNQRPQLKEVLKHLFIHKTQLTQQFWLDSILGLYVLGDAAKLNLSCLKVFMNIGKDFISNYMTPERQEESKYFDCSWRWILVYIYITILGDICLHAATSNLRKIAFMGFDDYENLSKYLELGNKNSKEQVKLKAANFLDLLKYFSSQMTYYCSQMTWTSYYGLIYTLVKMTRELYGDERQDGLGNILWKTLQRVKIDEKDVRVLSAIDIAEAELNDAINPFISSTIKAPRNPTFFQHIGGKLASALSKLFLPPLGTSNLLFKRHEKEDKSLNCQIPQYQMEKKLIHIFLRERPQVGEIIYPYPDVITRGNAALRALVENQWKKDEELRICLEELCLAQQKKQQRREDAEHFREMMKRREEKVHKTTKPYALSEQTSSEEIEPKIDRSSSDESSVEESYCIGKLCSE